MSPFAVLAILVASGQAQGPAVTAMMTAATEVVGAGDAVRLVETAAPSDAEALRVERSLSARAVVQLAWRDPSHLRARLRLHAARTDRWIDREIVFSVTDTLAERGRTLGFAIASMLPEGDPSLQFAEPPSLAEQAPAPPPAPLGRQVAGLSVLAGAGLGGPASGVGGGVMVESFLRDNLSVGLALSGRLGRIAEIGGSELTTSFAIGAALWPLAPTPTRRLGIALRGDALLLYHAISHVDPGGATQWKGQALPGAELRLEGTWRLGGAVELLLGAGTEVAFGTIDVTVVATAPAGGAATIPALRAIAEGGVRLRF
jgi:hypothetical protein